MNSEADPRTEFSSLETFCSRNLPVDFCRISLYAHPAHQHGLGEKAVTTSAGALGFPEAGGELPSMQMPNHSITAGDSINVQLTAGGMTDVVMTAEVQSIKSSLVDTVIEGRTGSQRLANARFNQVYENQTLRQIANDLAIQAGVDTGQIDAGSPVPYCVVHEFKNPYLANAHVTANINALGLTRNDVVAYVRRAIDGEHRAGFITRALFYCSYGQVLYNAMTDDSGIEIGRFLIRDNFNMVVNAATAAGAGFNAQQRAQITARIHNSGPAGLKGFVNNPATAVNAYVNNVMANWVP